MRLFWEGFKSRGGPMALVLIAVLLLCNLIHLCVRMALR